MTKLTFPFPEDKIRALKVGDEVLISGVVFTGRAVAGLASVCPRR
jgi:tartrate dehydratase beta subunit/fumarate hydratase class I family protein